MTENNIVKYEADKTEVVLSHNIIKNYLVSGDANSVTDQELELFMQLCKAQHLNPFKKEAYLIKYGSKPAQTVVGKDVFVKRALANPNCQGFEAGVIVMRNGNIAEVKGSFTLPSDQLVGGWAKVYIKNWKVPFEHSVSFNEFNTSKSTWNRMPGVMIRKVALSQALREAFPEDFQGLYDSSEMGVEIDTLDAQVIEPAPADTISQAQAKRMFAIAKNEDVVRRVMDNYGYKGSSKYIKIDDYDKIIDEIEMFNESPFFDDEVIEEVEVEEVSAEDLDKVNHE